MKAGLIVCFAIAVAGCSGKDAKPKALASSPLASTATPLSTAERATGDAIDRELSGGRMARSKRMVEAGAKPMDPSQTANYMTQQVASLRSRVSDDGITVVRKGDDVLIEIPAALAFASRSAKLRPELQEALDGIAATIYEYSTSLVDVYGHADATGTKARNNSLSQQRADAVSDYLVAREVDPDRIATRGYGSSQPIAGNDTEQGRAANRRIEIRIMPVRQIDVTAVAAPTGKKTGVVKRVRRQRRG